MAFKKGRIPWNKGKKGRRAWNKGLTKETDSRIKASSGSMKKGNIPWNKGLTKETNELVRKIGEKHKGKKLTVKTREKISAAKIGIGKGQKRPKEWKDKMSKSMIEFYKNNPAARKAASERTKKQMSDPLARKRISIAKKGQIISPERRKKHSIHMKKFWKENPDIRKLADERMKIALKNKPGYREFRQEVRRKMVLPRKDSKPEIRLQKILSGKKIIYEKHTSLVGQPDIFIPPDVCIFVDGDYWHGWEFLQGRDFSTQKKFNNEYFEKKIKYDLDVTKKLTEQGFKVLRFWEHEINEESEKCLNKILKKIKS